MWRALPPKGLLFFIVAFVALFIFALQPLLAMVGVEAGAFSWPQQISLIVFILDVVFVAAFNFFWKSIWKKWPKLGEWVFPDISGEWQAEINWTDQNGHTGVKPVKIQISQNWVRFKVALISDEARSESAYAWIEKDGEMNRATLAYVYGHVPIASRQQVNAAHEGTARLDFALGTPVEGRGQYYTARRTAGDIVMRQP